MAISQRLDLRQSQSLVMTPQLQQAIKLLQLSNLELGAYVERELEQNPLLEREDPDGAEGRGEPAERLPDAPPAPSADRIGTDRLTSAETWSSAADAPLDTDFANVWTNTDASEREEGGSPSGSGYEVDSAQDWGRTGSGGRFDEEEGGPADTLTRAETLRDHLHAQVSLELTDPTDLLIAAQLIDLLDEAGYLTDDPAVVADLLDCPMERVEAVLARLRQFDPPGVFARTLAECLALQLAERNRLDPAIRALLDNLPLLAARDYDQLLALCGVDRDDLVEMVAEIRALNPKPGHAFDPPQVQTVVPDILMRPTPKGGWSLELNSDTLPRVLVNHRYHAEVLASPLSKPERDYLSEQFASASWLVKSLHQRATTILKVATEIVRQQEAFFHHGVAHLRPLILRDIAEAIGMHESTVSRVTSNKFIASPRGLFELKYFFTAAIGGSDGAASHSAEAVRHRIRSLIESETTAKSVLSDERIVQILKDQGIDIARRTVAKYREAMRIPSSAQRRRAFSGAL